MFQVDEMVLYGTNGVCRVAAIEDRDCGGRMITYYILKPFYSAGSTVFVPVGNEKLTSRMRPVLTKDEIDGIIRSIPKEYSGWVDDEKKRKEKFKDIVGRADIFELIQLTKRLIEQKRSAMDRGRKPHIVDERMLQEAEKMICDEFSYVLGISKEEVPAYIKEVMREKAEA